MSKRYDGTISTKVTLVLIAMAILEILARQYRRKTDYEAGLLRFRAPYRAFVVGRKHPAQNSVL